MKSRYAHALTAWGMSARAGGACWTVMAHDCTWRRAALSNQPQHLELPCQAQSIITGEQVFLFHIPMTYLSNIKTFVLVQKHHKYFMYFLCKILICYLKKRNTLKNNNHLSRNVSIPGTHIVQYSSFHSKRKHTNQNWSKSFIDVNNE